ncbi:MAG: hypothetical protein WD398_01515 [Cyclobacteriaceae bacterium]
MRELSSFSGQFNSFFPGIWMISRREHAKGLSSGGADFIVFPTFLRYHAANCYRKDVLWVPGFSRTAECFRS